MNSNNMLYIFLIIIVILTIIKTMNYNLNNSLSMFFLRLKLWFQSLFNKLFLY